MVPGISYTYRDTKKSAIWYVLLCILILYAELGVRWLKEFLRVLEIDFVEIRGNCEMWCTKDELWKKLDFGGFRGKGIDGSIAIF